MVVMPGLNGLPTYPIITSIRRWKVDAFLLAIAEVMQRNRLWLTRGTGVKLTMLHMKTLWEGEIFGRRG